MPQRPSSPHTIGGRSFRRVVTATQNSTLGGSATGGSLSSTHLVLEEDGTSKLILEESAGFILKEEST